MHRFFNDFANAFKSIENIPATKAQNSKAVGFQIMRASLIVLESILCSVNIAIQLDNECRFGTKEIDDIRPDGVLSKKTRIMATQKIIPEMALGGCHVLTKLCRPLLRIWCMKKMSTGHLNASSSYSHDLRARALSYSLQMATPYKPPPPGPASLRSALPALSLQPQGHKRPLGAKAPRVCLSKEEGW